MWASPLIVLTIYTNWNLDSSSNENRKKEQNITNNFNNEESAPPIWLLIIQIHQSGFLMSLEGWTIGGQTLRHEIILTHHQSSLLNRLVLHSAQWQVTLTRCWCTHQQGRRAILPHRRFKFEVLDVRNECNFTGQLRSEFELMNICVYKWNRSVMAESTNVFQLIWWYIRISQKFWETANTWNLVLR